MADNQNNPQVPAEERELTEKEIGEQRQIKRKKLEELREMGRDPYLEETFDVTAWSRTSRTTSMPWKIRRSEWPAVSWRSAAWAR